MSDDANAPEDGKALPGPLAWARAHRTDADVPQARMKLLPPGRAPGTVENPIPRVPREEYVAATKGKGVAALAAKAPLTDVRIADIVSPQRTLNSERLAQHFEDPDLVPKGARAIGSGMPKDAPVVVKAGGKMYLFDGNHRVTAAKLRGKATAKVRLVDLDAAK